MSKTPIRKKVYAVKINAGNDANGNPRRGWLLYSSDGYLEGFVDEGYSGQGALREAAPNHVELCHLMVKPGEYREARKDTVYQG